MIRGYLKQFFRDVRAQKLRLALTLFGIVWGTVAVALLLAFGEGFRGHVTKSMKGIGENIVICWPTRTSKPFAGLPRGRPLRVTEADIDRLAGEVPEIAAISAEYSSGGLTFKAGRNTVSPTLVGVNPTFAAMRNIIPEEGSRFVNSLDAERRRRCVFLGDELKENLFGAIDAVGRYVMVNRMPYLVVGVMKPKDQDSSYNGRDKDRATIASSTFKAIYGRQYPDNFVFSVDDPKNVERAKEGVIASLARTHKFDTEDKEAVMMWDTTEMLDFIGTFFLAFNVFLGVVGALTLVVGGIGVSNIMNVVVEERTKEVGIKMALGAKKGYVVGQFLTETMLITFVGGALGFLICYGIVSLVPALGLSEHVGNPSLSLKTASLTAGILGVIGLLAGYFPARTAANLNPVEALRM
ncbi:MAG: ABC transporter permease [Candidatus Eisenbacteria bacterium]